ncbi:MAG: hypothetical protein ACK5YU_10345 [Burkholderiales bacterium]|jgi:hypothetical protein
MSKVEIILPDAGPLISLALGEALPDLLKLGMPVHIVDQVYFEVTGNLGHPGAKEARDFVESNPMQVHVATTTVGRLAAVERESDPLVRHRGLGEAAIGEFLSRLDEYVTADAPILLVYEDGDVQSLRVTNIRRVHLIGTRELLIAMQEETLIPSADAVFTKMLGKGRAPSRNTLEQPAETRKGESTWRP